MTQLPLIHIGYHKTATTWLQEHLFRNTAIGFAVQNGSDRIFREFVTRGPFLFEVGQTRETLAKHRLEAADSALVPVITQERLSGSPHTGGYDSQIIADRLKAVFPEARILIVIRKQVDIILSGYKQYVRNGGRQSLGLYLAPPENGAHHIPAFRPEFFEYHWLIEYYQTLFGKAQVLGLPYELFVSQPNTFLKKILLFNELEGNEAIISGMPVGQRSHGSLSYFATNLKRILSAVADVPSRYQHRGVFILTPEQRQAVLGFLARLDGRLPVSIRQGSEARARAMIEREVKDRFDRSNLITGRLLDLSLEDFGYKVKLDA